MEIPYIVQPREDTGLYNAKVGIWLFLASEVMLFGALFSSYILLRVGAEVGTWPHGLLNIPIGTLNTIVLITSSVTVVLAWALWWVQEVPKKPELPQDIVKLSVHETQAGCEERAATRRRASSYKKVAATDHTVMKASTPHPSAGRASESRWANRLSPAYRSEAKR